MTLDHRRHHLGALRSALSVLVSPVQYLVDMPVSVAKWLSEGLALRNALLTENATDVLPEGGQIVDDPNAPLPVPMIGHVTSSYFSACLGHSIALALVKGGRSRMGETVYVPLADGRVISAKISSSVFYDPQGARQNV